MRHADDDLLDAALAALLDQIVEQRDQRVAAFEREALLRRILRREIALEPFGRGQVTQERLALLAREAMLDAAVLEAILQPQALGRIRHVRELGADRAAVDVAQLRDDVAQLHALRDRLGAAAGVELGVEIRVAQAEVLELEHLGHRSPHQAERIDVGEQMTAIRVHLDERATRRPASPRRRRWLRRAARRCCRDRRTRRALAQRLANRPMRRVVARRRGCGSTRARSARPSSDRRETVRREIRRRGRCRPPGAWSRAKLAKSRSLRSQVPVLV